MLSLDCVVFVSSRVILNREPQTRDRQTHLVGSESALNRRGIHQDLENIFSFRN